MNKNGRPSRIETFLKTYGIWLIFGVIFVVVTIWAFRINSSIDQSTDKTLSAIKIDESDQDFNWARYQTVDVNLPEITPITSAGTYHLSGNLLGAPIIVDASTKDVKLILDNVIIDNPTGPAILCKNAGNLVIELVGENILQDGANYEDTYKNYDEDIVGTIYSKSDLFFTGSGTLTINSQNQNAIRGKDDVKFSSGTYNINSAFDAIHGKDSVYFAGGNFTINSTNNAIETTNDIDFGKGFILAENADFNITTGGKGFRAIQKILIYGGNINIVKSYEGISSKVISINGGQINISSFDDGINAGTNIADEKAIKKAKTDENCIISINDGEIYINSAGDGIDSNGYLNFNGGQTIIDGPTSGNNGALDFGLGINMQGGEVIAVGSSGMAETLGSSGNVCNLSVFFDNEYPAGTKIEIKDASGSTILSHISAKNFSHLAAGSKNLTLANSYSIYINDEKYSDFTVMSVTTTIGTKNQNFQNNPLHK